MVQKVGTARTVDEALHDSLEVVREAFGWGYGSYWALDPKEKVLKFAVESGSVNEEFRRVTLEARFREGEGLSGRAWKARDLVFVPDLGQMRDCCRAPVAQRAGVKSGICLPIMDDDKVIGTMDFFATETLDLSQERMEALRNVGHPDLEIRQEVAYRRDRPGDRAKRTGSFTRSGTGRHRSFSPRGDSVGPGYGARGIRLGVRLLLGARPRGECTEVRRGVGIGQRGVPPGDARGPVPGG